jgi:hypothetical protein
MGFKPTWPLNEGAVRVRTFRGTVMLILADLLVTCEFPRAGGSALNRRRCSHFYGIIPCNPLARLETIR